MNNWQETSEIVERLAALAAEGERAALATVVAIDGSAYRKPGAKLLVTESGETLGGVSGGCLEADVREIARGVLASGRPVLKVYDTGSAHEEIMWGLGLGCDGRVEVLVQPAAPGALAALAPRLAALLRGEEPFTLATRLPRPGGPESAADVLLLAGASATGSLGSPELDRRASSVARALAASGRSAIRALGDDPVFLDLLLPPPHLVICGAGDDARALVDSAVAAGFRVTVLDHRAALPTPARFPGAARLAVARPDDRELELPEPSRSLAVLMMHSYAHDRDWARRLLAAGVPFVGLLGPRARTARIRSEIGAVEEPRLFGPVGLDLGAEGARQIAISIVAQLLAFQSGRVPRPLAERAESFETSGASG
jgi:xanthine/CO dehydrogenase XdhC/CoxF family maturation factor